MDEVLFKQIEDFKFQNRYKNQTQAVIALIEKGIDFFYKKSKIKPISPFSDDAAKIAKRYDNLDIYGKSTVKAVITEEEIRMEEQAELEATMPDREPKVINLYLEPAAAGIATAVEGKDYVMIELGPDDPQGAAYAVRLQGDSMEPDFPDGSTVFVNHDSLVDGDIGIFSIDGGTVCKQYHRDPLGMVYLFSLNRARADADVVIHPSSNHTLICQGRVITKRRYPLPHM